MAAVEASLAQSASTSLALRPRRRRQRCSESQQDEILCSLLREPQVARRRSLVVVSSAAYGAPDRAKQDEDQPDHQEDDPDYPQDGDLGDESDYQQDDAESDHSFSSPAIAVSASTEQVVGFCPLALGLGLRSL